LRGTHTVLLNKLRPQAVALAHESHLRILGTKQNLRSKVWWPAMDKAAEKFCKLCHGCQLLAPPDPTEPLTSTTFPEGPWKDLAVDLFGGGRSILVVVDYYILHNHECVRLTSTTSAKVINSLEEVFSCHGLPVTIMSDNSPQFCSEEFQDYCAHNGISHLKVTPKWPQANREV